MTTPFTPQDSAPRVAVFTNGRFVGWPFSNESDEDCLARLRPVSELLYGRELLFGDVAPLQVLKACHCMPPQPIVDCTICWPVEEGEG